MLKPEESANQIFEKIADSIVQSCKEHDWTISRTALLSLGFIESNVSSKVTYAQRYDLMITPAIHICLNYRSVDPSGPFQNLPDVSKFDLDLIINGQKTKSYQSQYVER